MPGAGTDKTKTWVDASAPIIILVEPQLGENIGAAARVMANFALRRLRLVKPRDGWPNIHARRAASGADRLLDEAELYDTLDAAIADCTLVLATTARAHDQAKPVISPEAAATLLAPRVAAGENVAVMFGRERYGLENDEVALADRIVTFPVNPAFASLNLAQAVAVIAYEWFKLACGGTLPFAMPQKSSLAGKEQVQAFFAHLERQLDAIEYFRPLEKRATMLVNLRNIFARMQPTQQDIQTLHGIVVALTEGRKGPARGGVLDGEEAAALRALLAEHGQDGAAPACGPMRGLSRLLRRNPTDAERALWHALTNDRRFAGKGIKRQVPVGPHITDFVSFALRLVIELVPAQESKIAAKARGERRAWLMERGYRVLEVAAEAVEAGLPRLLDELARTMAED
ncbi:MAG TPA: TrmJ/YjtD family RNA methyltransferase [Xanthobacteraceae bacterium]|jgi:tRNA/rRNA methyltransferase|nr:TrmJ/YjtD family RNA methyltransferase [Xanthobacteraceae bacterium]